MKIWVYPTGLYSKNKEGSPLMLLKIIYLFIYFWLLWVFVAARQLSLVAESEGYSFVLEPRL